MKDGMAAACRLAWEPLDAGRVLAAVHDHEAGANVLFVGTTRCITHGLPTSRLVYEAHESLATSELERLRLEAIRCFGLLRCVVHHRLGPVDVGEASVLIAASATHRREAFAAVEWLMARIKARVPIWKCEERPDGSRAWVHPDGEASGAPATSATQPHGGDR